MAKEKDILNPCGHRNSERVKALMKLPSSIMCPACLLERLEKLEADFANYFKMAAKSYTACGNYQQQIGELKTLLEQLIFIAEKSTTDDAEDTTIELANQALGDK